jgi:hypothetical protein
MTDKNGKRLKIGDWVYYPKLRAFTNIFVYDFFVGQITSFGNNEGGCFVTLTNDPGRYCNYIEKLPKNEKKREQIVLLKKFEGCHTITQRSK